MKTRRQIRREIKVARESFAGMGDAKVLKRHPGVSQEDLDAWKKVHREFITDPDIRPDDLTEYIKECQAKPEAEPDEEPTVEQPEKRRPGRPRKNPLPE